MLGKILPVCLAFGLAALSPTLAQTPSYAFSFNSGNSERMVALALANDGHVLTFTRVKTDSQEVIRLQKLNREGTTIFDKYFDIQVVNGAIRTADGNNVIVGQKELNGKNVLVLTKLNTEGKPLWFKTFGPISDNPDLAPRIQSTLDGGFVLLRYQPYALSTTKFFDSWKKFYDVKKWEGVEPVAQLTKFSQRGNQQWTYRYAQFPGGRIHDIATTDDSGMVLVGEQYLNDRFTHSAFLVKVKKNGQPEWSQNFVKGTLYRGISVVSLKTGYGMMCNLGENNSLHVLRLDNAGKIIWDKLLVAHGADNARLLPNDEGGFLCVGKTYYGDLSLTNQKPEHASMYVADVSESGTIVWERNVGAATSYLEPTAAVANATHYQLSGSLGVFTQQQGFVPQEALVMSIEKHSAKPQAQPIIADASTARMGRPRGMEPATTTRGMMEPTTATRGIEPPAQPTTGVSPLPYPRPLPPSTDAPLASQPDTSMLMPINLPARPATAAVSATEPPVVPTAPVVIVAQAVMPTAVHNLPATVLSQPVATVVPPTQKPAKAASPLDIPLPTKAEMMTAAEAVATQNIHAYLKSTCPACADIKPRKTETGYTVKCDIKAAGPEPLIWQEIYFDERGNRAERITYIKDWDSNYLASKDYITLIRIRCYCQVVLKQPIIGAVQIIELSEGEKNFIVSTADGAQTAFGVNGRPVTQ